MTQDLVDLFQRLVNGETVNFCRDDGTPCQLKLEAGTIWFYVKGCRGIHCDAWGLSTFMKVASMSKNATVVQDLTPERYIEI